MILKMEINLTYKDYKNIQEVIRICNLTSKTFILFYLKNLNDSYEDKIVLKK